METSKYSTYLVKINQLNKNIFKQLKTIYHKSCCNFGE